MFVSGSCYDMFVYNPKFQLITYLFSLYLKHIVDNLEGKYIKGICTIIEGFYYTCLLEDTFIYYFLHILKDIQMKINRFKLVAKLVVEVLHFIFL